MQSRIEFFITTHFHRFSYVVANNQVVNMLASPTDHVVTINEVETCRFGEPVLSFQPKIIFIGKSRNLQLKV